MAKPRVVDLFCGAGGFARGFRDAGFRIVLGVDCFKPAALTYKLNFPEAVVIADDIKNVDGGVILDILGGEVDVVIGSPPCEPFTAANPRRMRKPLDRLYVDPIGRLVLHFIRIVADLQPRVFVLENVPHLAEGDLKRALRAEFRRVGYPRIYFNMLRAERYGTPSRRLRLFVSNIKIRPKPSLRSLTVEDALRGLPEPNEEYPPNHRMPSMSRRLQRRIRRLKWGQALVRFYGDEGRMLGNIIRLDPRKPAPTVMGSRRFVHPYEDRLLTVREQARLMGFPDDHVFLGGADVQYNQVGEAVPVPLAKAIAEEVAKALKHGNISGTRLHL